jgi:hypothetical protein
MLANRRFYRGCCANRDIQKNIVLQKALFLSQILNERYPTRDYVAARAFCAYGFVDTVSPQTKKVPVGLNKKHKVKCKLFIFNHRNCWLSE